MTDAANMVEIIANYGVTIVLCGLFLWQWVKSQTQNDRREEKLYDVIASLADAIPDIKTQLARVENKIDDISHERRTDYYER